MKTVIVGAKALLPECIRQCQAVVENGCILDVAEHVPLAPDDRVIQGEGLYLCPGFVDIHVHGGGGFSAMSGKAEDVIAMANAHARHGTTSILPTTLAAPLPNLLKAVHGVRRAAALPCDAAILGVHLEGPCLSPAQTGAQSPDDLKIPAETDLTPLLDAWPGGVRMMGAAPELPGALALGDQLAARGIVASIAHSNATYSQVEEALSHGYCDVTHLYSSCSGLIRVHSYRVPGVIEAGLNLDALTVQVIADGKHLPLSLLQLIYRCKGAEKIELITDGLEFAAGDLVEGAVYRQLNGVETVYEDGVMKLLSRESFAGSVATMHRCVRTMVQAGIPLRQAVRMASENPARRVGAAKKGRIAPGMDADLLLLDEKLDVKWVMAGGRIIRDFDAQKEA
ncbi:MAG: N-acetylglucosamine-6-phosphate deacetylase [Clostridia bacterium]|nr:N-acetylglucosamine-6-phosphate deacetylase [Clostridia bacterium]